MSSEFAALTERIRDALTDVERTVRRAEELRDKAQRTSDDGYWDGVALNLHGFYNGLERIFEDIARTVDVNVPSGPAWHQDLLRRMSIAISDLRPAVIRSETRRCLDEYRDFRHIVRHVYAFNLRPLRVQELANESRACYGSVSRDLNEFIDFLERMAQADETLSESDE